jgi:putative transposase
MKAHQADHSITLMSRVLRVSRAGYYAWLGRGPSMRAQSAGLLLEEIRTIHLTSRGIYGVRRIHAALLKQGWRVGKNRVARCMAAAGIVGVTRRRYKATTVRNPRQRPAPDLVERQFTASGADVLWVADITHIPTAAGAVYLAVIQDVWSRRIVGWAVDSHMESELVQRALLAALARRRPVAVIHHSDQGSQYTARAFKALAEAHGVRLSMGTVADCYDNAMAESFFATLECELLALHRLRGLEDARRALFDFIEGFYNLHRLHSGVGYRSPIEFEHGNVRAMAAAK